MRSKGDPAKQEIARLSALGKHLDVAAGGLRVRWHEFGSGPPVVLLHGGHGNWLHWLRTIEALQSSFTLLVPDMPGFGESEAPPAHTLTALVDALAASLHSRLGSSSVDVVGFSFGGLVAASLALRRQVARLVLLAPAGHGTARRPKGELQGWRKALESGDVARFEQVMRENLRLHMLHRPPDDLALAIHIDACLQTRFRSRPISQAGGLLEALRRLECPVHIAWGEHDTTAIPKDLARDLRRSDPGIVTRIVPAAGHWVMYEEPEATHALLRRWLG